MQRLEQPEQPVVIEFTQDEARRLKDSLFSDFTWSETSEPDLYDSLFVLLWTD